MVHPVTVALFGFLLLAGTAQAQLPVPIREDLLGTAAELLRNAGEALPAPGPLVQKVEEVRKESESTVQAQIRAVEARAQDMMEALVEASRAVQEALLSVIRRIGG